MHTFTAGQSVWVDLPAYEREGIPAESFPAVVVSTSPPYILPGLPGMEVRRLDCPHGSIYHIDPRNAQAQCP